VSVTEPVVLLFGGRRLPGPLQGLSAATITDSRQLDQAIEGARRVVVVGADSDLAALLTRLMRTDRLDVEVAYVPRRRTAATRAYHLPTGRRAAKNARTATAQRVPLIRDDTGRVIVGAALWVGETGLEKGARPAALHGEAVVDDTVLFDGEVPAVRVEPTRAMPGLRGSVLSGRMRPRRWATGRAAQLGTTGAFVARDGELTSRPVRRSTFYRHTTGWLAVG
jgi:hypothetical protein